MTRRVAGGVDNAEAAAGQRDDLVVREKAVGSGLGAHRRLTLGRQFECITVGFGGSSAFHVLELVGHPFVVACSRHLIEQVVVVLMHGDPGAGRPRGPRPHSPVWSGWKCVTTTPSMSVTECPISASPALRPCQPLSSPQPASTKISPPGGFHGVDERVPERVVRDRDRNLEYAITDGRRTVHNKYLLTIRERTLSTSCLPCARLVGDTGPAWREFGMFSGDFGSEESFIDRMALLSRK